MSKDDNENSVDFQQPDNELNQPRLATCFSSTESNDPATLAPTETVGDEGLRDDQASHEATVNRLPNTASKVLFLDSTVHLPLQSTNTPTSYASALPPVVSHAEQSRAHKATLLRSISQKFKMRKDRKTGWGYAVNESAHSAFPIRQLQFARYITRTSRELGRGLSELAVKEVIAELEASLPDRPDVDIFTRVAHVDDTIFVDMDNGQNQVVQITRDGWNVTDQCPVYFRARENSKPLPHPAHGAGSMEFMSMFTFAEPGDSVLVKAWMVQTLFASAPCPILTIQAPKGSGKTTLTEFIVACLDPREVGVLSASTTANDLFIAAQNGVVLPIDNLTNIAGDTSDVLCQIVMGANTTKRKLYTDGDEYVLRAKAAIILTSINALTTERADLRDRCVQVGLEAVDSTKRLTLAEIEPRLKAELPEVLAFLYGAASEALRRASRPSQLTRMADFCATAVAASHALGVQPADMESLLFKNEEDKRRNAVACDGVAAPVLAFLENEVATRCLALGELVWEGTVSVLLDILLKRPGHWSIPRGPAQFSAALSRIEADLRGEGFFHMMRKGDIRLHQFFFAGKGASAASESGAPSNHPQEAQGYEDLPAGSRNQGQIAPESARLLPVAAGAETGETSTALADPITPPRACGADEHTRPDRGDAWEPPESWDDMYRSHGFDGSDDEEDV